MSSRSTRAALGAAGVGLLAAIFSFGRIFVANSEAPAQVLWAEDGLFPLCSLKAGVLACLADPFAGYLLTAPRLVAGVLAGLPASQWALATNIAAALVAGLLAALAFSVARRFGLGAVASVIVAVLPVFVPIAGVEAVNAIGSLYMPLLYTATLAVVIVRPPITRACAWGITVLLLLTALTMPSAGILLAVVAFHLVRRTIDRWVGLAWAAALALGMLAQAAAALTAERPRPIALSAGSWGSFVETLGAVLATTLGWAPRAADDGGVALPQVPVWVGGVALAALTASAVLLVTRRRESFRAAGILVLSGIAFALVPSAIGWANNRYYVAPMALWLAALVVVLDAPVREWAVGAPRKGVVVVALAAIALVWAPQFPASDWRTTPAPAWQGEVARVAAHCRTDPSLVERPIFSPFWPPNWGDGLTEPTHPNIPCLLVWGWS